MSHCSELQGTTVGSQAGTLKAWGTPWCPALWWRKEGPWTGRSQTLRALRPPWSWRERPAFACSLCRRRKGGRFWRVPLLFVSYRRHAGVWETVPGTLSPVAPHKGSSEPVMGATLLTWFVSFRANSVTWNPHKMMGVPLQCSALLVREEVCLSSLVATSIVGVG